METIELLMWCWFGAGFLAYLLCMVENWLNKVSIFPDTLLMEISIMIAMSLLGVWSFIDFFIYAYNEYWDEGSEDL